MPTVTVFSFLVLLPNWLCPVCFVGLLRCCALSFWVISALEFFGGGWGEAIHYSDLTKETTRALLFCTIQVTGRSSIAVPLLPGVDQTLKHHPASSSQTAPDINASSSS